MSAQAWGVSTLNESHAFIVRIWSETVDEEGNTLIWRGVIEDVTTGRQIGFEDMLRLTLFIREQAKLPADTDQTHNKI